MAKKIKQAWRIGDYFTVTLADKSFSIGQIIGIETDALNSAICAFYSKKTKLQSEIIIDGLREEDLVAVLFVTRDLLDSGDWKVFAHGQEINTDKFFALSELRANGFIGLKVIGSGIIIKFMDAYFGLYPWDGFYVPDYLDKLLLSPNRKPTNIVMKN